MGFVKAPGSYWDKILFVNNCQGYPWSWPENQPCKESAIEGTPKGLMVREAEYKGEVVEKLHFLLADEDGTTYCLRVGLDTVFSRGLLLGLKVALADKADRPIIVVPQVSEREEKVIFCNLYAAGQKVRYEWDCNIDCLSLALSLAVKYFPDIPFQKDKEGDSGIKPSSTGEVSLADLKAKNDADLKRLGIPQPEAVNLLLTRYGKKSRLLLSDSELLDFVAYVDELVKNSASQKDDIPF
jgi:hypothetical protein